MGSAVLESLKSIDEKIVPKTIILDRALPSIWKVGRQQMNLPFCWILYFFAWLSGWAGNPEQSLHAFFERIKQENTNSKASLSDRNVIMLEAEHDFYFSGNGAFQPDTARRLNQVGVNAFQKKFTHNHLRMHARAHHACPLNHLINYGSDCTQGTFTIQKGQDVASAIVHNIFMNKMKID